MSVICCLRILAIAAPSRAATQARTHARTSQRLRHFLALPWDLATR
eukprot:CAMPEP_0184524766 /NCGR_PEP_ID=MMETSP0198_2-20121128/9713_1 /TAXON_ID=1112570 /ORGANISM="Thraustochytrium sp., Strain LLF1b" /LENGTH=45 /DNA_ID= /DNA_START= /DNA_END= /DNA_ORIENTATION=